MLVDSTHPQRLQGAGAVEAWPAWLRALYPLITRLAAVAERAQINLTGQQVLRLPVAPEVPTTLLVALQPVVHDSAPALDANARRLYPNAKFIRVGSGRGISREHPEVVAAIRDLLHPAVK